MRPTSPKEAITLNDFLEKLEKLEIPSVLLRNYEGFPHAIGNDLDVYVPKEHALAAARLLIDLAIAQGGVLCHAHCRSYFKACFFKFPDSSDILHVDVYHGALTWHGIPFLDERQVVQRSQAVGNARIPSPPDEALSLLLTSILWGGFFKERYRPRIQELLAMPCHRDRAVLLLQKACGEDAVALLDEVLSNQKIDGKAWSSILRRRLIVKAVKSHPYQNIKHWMLYWVFEIKLLFSNLGFEIQIITQSESQGLVFARAAKYQLQDLVGEVVIRTLKQRAHPHIYNKTTNTKEFLRNFRNLSKNNLVISIIAAPPTAMGCSYIHKGQPRIVHGKKLVLSDESLSEHFDFYHALAEFGLLEKSSYQYIPWKK